jgi:hypothetical protein
MFLARSGAPPALFTPLLALILLERAFGLAFVELLVETHQVLAGLEHS